MVNKYSLSKSLVSKGIVCEQPRPVLTEVPLEYSGVIRRQAILSCPRCLQHKLFISWKVSAAFRDTIMCHTNIFMQLSHSCINYSLMVGVSITTCDPLTRITTGFRGDDQTPITRSLLNKPFSSDYNHNVKDQLRVGIIWPVDQWWTAASPLDHFAVVLSYGLEESLTNRRVSHEEFSCSISVQFPLSY